MESGIDETFQRYEKKLPKLIEKISKTMINSKCTTSFFKHDLQKARLQKGLCPVKACSPPLSKIPFHKYNIPFCPEHGIRIHKNTFVYYNGSSKEEQILATRRNLMFHSDYYIDNFFKKKSSKAESERLCYENSEDAVSYNIFTELLAKDKLNKLVELIADRHINEDIELYLWGGKIDLKNNKFSLCEPLLKVREHLESGIKYYKTEPDIILIVPKKLIICFEAKFGSKNPIAEDKEVKPGEKPKKREELIERYCVSNKIIDADEIFNLDKNTSVFYEQLFRNLVFASSMAELEDKIDWKVVNLRSQYVLDLNEDKQDTASVVENVHSYLKPEHRKRFKHLTWEEIYRKVVKKDPELSSLAWYMENKSLSCGKAFNILQYG